MGKRSINAEIQSNLISNRKLIIKQFTVIPHLWKLPTLRKYIHTRILQLFMIKWYRVWFSANEKHSKEYSILLIREYTYLRLILFIFQQLIFITRNTSNDTAVNAEMLEPKRKAGLIKYLFRLRKSGFKRDVLLDAVLRQHVLLSNADLLSN